MFYKKGKMFILKIKIVTVIEMFFHSLHPRVCIDNLNEIRSVFTHRFLYFLTLFFRNTTCFGCHQPSLGVSNPKLRHRFKTQILKTILIVV